MLTPVNISLFQQEEYILKQNCALAWGYLSVPKYIDFNIFSFSKDV